MITGSEAVQVLVATKAKPNQNIDSPLDREFFISFLDVSLSMFHFVHKFLNVFLSTL